LFRPFKKQFDYSFVIHPLDLLSPIYYGFVAKSYKKEKSFY